jgi:hypothetical protein
MTAGAHGPDDPSDWDLRRVVEALVERCDRLEETVDRLTAENAELRAENQDLKDEIARLKGHPPRPKFKTKPSGMEKATSRSKRAKAGKERRGSVKEKLAVTSEVKLKVEAPAGSRFKGYEDVFVQGLQIRVAVVRYRRERWETKDGERIIAPLPQGILGGFGPELRRFIAAGHFQGQVTSERLTALLGGMGLQISKRQVVRLLSKGLEDLIAEDRAVLRTGLETARWVSVDDTSARHNGRDGVVTQLGDQRFTIFRTGFSKSRRAFLGLLQAGRSEHIVNDAALAKMRAMNMAATQIEQLARHPDKRFATTSAWEAHLKSLGFDQLKVHPNPVNVATECALWGTVCEQGLLGDSVVVSDGAGQFRVGENHALCWVHCERLVHKLQPRSKTDRRAVDLKRSLIWWLYADLKAYQREPDPKRARALRARFDRIFTKPTGYPMLDRLLRRLHHQKSSLLRVLERPEIPLHTNGSENDIRALVTKRKISGGTVSEAGKIARDTMLGLMKTCAKLGISYYRFLGDRFYVPGVQPVPSLAGLIAQAEV